ncbi:hypothetical protein [Nocardia sp. NPDC046763]|uniref:hypothetical protein n=1 Tax=Nocardia sp. NPDC046763 TaxID=3155256 RepID=UPI0033EB784A
MLLLADGHGSWVDTGTMVGTIAAAVIALLAFLLATKAAADAHRQADAASKSAQAVADQVNVAKDQLAQDRSAFETSIRPMIVDAPIRRDRRHTTDEDADTNVWWNVALSTKDIRGAGTAGVVMELRNVGASVAFVQGVRIGAVDIHTGDLDRQVVPAGESARFEYFVPKIKYKTVGNLVKALEDGTAYIAVAYTDLPGRQRLLTKIWITADTRIGLPPLRDMRKPLKVGRVDVYHCADDWTPDKHPFATTDWKPDRAR